MEPLNYLEILNAAGRFSSTDVALFGQYAVTREVRRNTVLVKPGQVAHHAFFNLSGAFYQYRINEDNDLQILELYEDRGWFLDQQSFVSRKPAQSFLEAYEDSWVVEISLSAMHQLITLSPVFFQLGRILDTANARLHFFDRQMTPAEKYRYILEHRPALLQKFPLKLIASYLKITPETLSRVREQFSKNGRLS